MIRIILSLGFTLFALNCLSESVAKAPQSLQVEVAPLVKESRPPNWGYEECVERTKEAGSWTTATEICGCIADMIREDPTVSIKIIVDTCQVQVLSI